MEPDKEAPEQDMKFMSWVPQSVLMALSKANIDAEKLVWLDAVPMHKRDQYDYIMTHYAPRSVVDRSVLD